ncbi:hypothetical protein C8A01DRAFT_33562 [Parachaetomium inaequale]|uniref:Uncharacterized protein n=1 Tax=Parachaetomium inaequale TaxID=2588326 RepID=A0AAN6PK40_9PEZI|nr:hypothetical protein C8A01DRAFT_33562 [Parachaetomium inaequale]
MSLHLQTHHAHRPPPQIPHNPSASKHSALANSILPPPQILHLIHLHNMHYTTPDRARSLAAAQAQTDLLTTRFTSPQTPAAAWPALKPLWLTEQHTNPFLTKQARLLATHLTTTLTPAEIQSTIIPTLTATTTTTTTITHHPSRERRTLEIASSPSQLSLLIYLYQHTRRLCLAQRELVYFRAHSRRLRQRAWKRAGDWVRASEGWRDHSTGRRRLARAAVGYRFRREGAETAREFDAVRWGVEMRGLTAKGKLGGEKWPGQEWFEVYKGVRYGRWWRNVKRREDRRREVEGVLERRGLRGAWGSGLLLRGGSPLRRGWTVS